MNFKIAVACFILAFTLTTTQANKLDNALLARYLCVNRPDNFEAIVPGSCTKYYKCEGGKTRVVTCKDGKFYDYSKKECVRNNPGCVETIVKMPDCKGPCCGITNGGYINDAKEQGTYYLCQNNKIAQTNKCDNGEMFDLVKLECSLASECANCITPKPCN